MWAQYERIVEQFVSAEVLCSLNLFLFKCQYVLPSLMTKTPRPENLCFELSSPLKEYLRKMKFGAGMSYHFGAVNGTEPIDYSWETVVHSWCSYDVYTKMDLSRQRLVFNCIEQSKWSDLFIAPGSSQAIGRTSWWSGWTFSTMRSKHLSEIKSIFCIKECQEQYFQVEAKVHSFSTIERGGRGGGDSVVEFPLLSQ